MSEPVNPDVTAVQKSATADKPASLTATAASGSPPSVPSTGSPPSDRADLRPENINDAVIRLAGNSQDGIQTAGAFLARLAGRSDHDVMTYMTIPSTISGGPSIFQVRMGTGEVLSAGDEADFLVAFYQHSYQDHIDFLKEGGVLLYDSDNVEPNLDDKRFVYVGVPITGLTVEALGGTAKDKGKNIFVLGLIAKIFSLDVEKLATLIKEKFAGKDESIVNTAIMAFTAGYAYPVGKVLTHQYQFEHKPKTGGPAQITMDGNQAIAYGLIAAGVRYGAGYPITPWSSIMETLRRELPKYGGIFVQAENELGAVSLWLGISYSGYLACHPDRGVRRTRSFQVDGRSETGPHPASGWVQALRSRAHHAARPARDAHARWKISASVGPRARRDGPSNRQPEITHGDDGEAPEEITKARRRNSGAGSLRRPGRRHAPCRLGIDLRPHSRRGENGARTGRENRCAPFAPHSSAAERARENLRQIQAHRHRGDERPGHLRVRSARHHFARPLLRTQNRKRDQDRRPHLPGERNSPRRFSRQVCLTQGLFTKSSGFRKRRTRCRDCPPRVYHPRSGMIKNHDRINRIHTIGSRRNWAHSV